MIRSALCILLYVLSACACAGSYEEFFSAINRDDLATVQGLIERGIDANTLDPHGEPALIHALRRKALKVAQWLISVPEINLNQANQVGETPLMLAVFIQQKDLVDQLLAQQVEVNQPGWTALHYAAAVGNNQLVALLLEHSAYIDAEAPNLTTPIMMAARAGHIRTVKLLLDEGADFTLKNDQGLTAQDFAKNHGFREIAEGLRLRAQRIEELKLKPWK